MAERRVNARNRERFEELRERLVARLQRVCRDMPQRELDRLTAAMTRVYLKYEPSTALPDQESGGRTAFGI